MATTPKPAGIPPRRWVKQEVEISLSTLYSLWERGIGPASVMVGGKRLVLEDGPTYLARMAAEQSKAAL